MPAAMATAVQAAILRTKGMNVILAYLHKDRELGSCFFEGNEERLLEKSPHIKTTYGTRKRRKMKTPALQNSQG